MWSVEVVEVLPLAEFGFQIDVSFVAQQLIKLLAVGAVLLFHLSVELRRTTFDVSVADAEILDMPMELGLELVPVVGSDFAYAERELVDDVIDEVDRVGLSIFFTNLERTNAGGIVIGRILEPAYLLAPLSDESQELDIHLDMVTRDLFVVAFGVYFAQARSARVNRPGIAGGHLV